MFILLLKSLFLGKGQTNWVYFVCCLVVFLVPLDNFSFIITGDGLQTLTYARHLRPMSSEDSLACQTYCDTGHPFIMVIFEDPWHPAFLLRLRNSRGNWVLMNKELLLQRSYGENALSFIIIFQWFFYWMKLMLMCRLKDHNVNE